VQEGSISYEEWMARHPESKFEIHNENPVMVENIKQGGFSGSMMTQAEWLQSHPEQNHQRIASITQEEWLARQGGVEKQNQPIASITQEEWLTRQGRVESVQTGTIRETITQEEWAARQQPGYIKPISEAEWYSRQGGPKSEIRTEYVSNSYNGGQVREEVVKKSGNVHNVAPYDYRDFRPLEFNYEYREYKPMQYETTYVESKGGEQIVHSPVRTVIYESSPPKQQQQVIVQERAEGTKQGGMKKQLVIEEHERGSSRWCC
jgi:hypothetical protein